ncbi:fumarylacetoacetate hydrolase family protein [Streptomyces sp. NPDC093544]|jgi:2-keto-4-pentenoate hydratase/2-oxohepta-3-ene-1,7-dioic acid hydratase in catechol pathway|uniref:fumarylacetoacetate hydrolase family protein n=1 Tax=Streptomyces sp. NPDC093544 TaxID=3155200 RepID=UPI00341D4EC1
MRFVSFGPRGNERPGVLVNDSSILPLSRVMADIGIAPNGTIRNLLPFLDRVSEGVAAAVDRGDEVIPVAQTRLGPPITDPLNLFNCGANYLSHLVEIGAEATPTLPVVFQKPSSALAGPTDAIVRPLECVNLDYEAELVVVIGKAGRRIPAERAAEHIAGFMITNDVSARDLGEGESRKLNAPALFQLMRTKGWDTFQPTGPWLVTLDEARSYEDIRIQTWVNDELRQDAYAKEMLHSPYKIIEWLSATTTLQPGDIITTGTPGGVAAGMASPKWLMPGDTVRIEMTGLGQMNTPVLDEQGTRAGGRGGSDG